MVAEPETGGAEGGWRTVSLRTWGQLGCLAAMNLYLISPVLLYELGLSSARGAGIEPHGE